MKKPIEQNCWACPNCGEVYRLSVTCHLTPSAEQREIPVDCVAETVEPEDLEDDDGDTDDVGARQER